MTFKERPVVNWPERSGEYRAVQLYVGDRPYLVLEEGENKFHAQILRSALVGLNLPFAAAIGQKTGRSVPSPEGNGYRAVGMGKVRVDIDSRKAKAFGESDDYRLCISVSHLDQIRALQPNWGIE